MQFAIVGQMGSVLIPDSLHRKVGFRAIVHYREFPVQYKAGTKYYINLTHHSVKNRKLNFSTVKLLVVTIAHGVYFILVRLSLTLSQQLFRFYVAHKHNHVCMYACYPNVCSLFLFYNNFTILFLLS